MKRTLSIRSLWNLPSTEFGWEAVLGPYDPMVLMAAGTARGRTAAERNACRIAILTIWIFLNFGKTAGLSWKIIGIPRFLVKMKSKIEIQIRFSKIIFSG